MRELDGEKPRKSADGQHNETTDGLTAGPAPHQECTHVAWIQVKPRRQNTTRGRGAANRSLRVISSPPSLRGSAPFPFPPLLLLSPLSPNTPLLGFTRLVRDGGSGGRRRVPAPGRQGAPRPPRPHRLQGMRPHHAPPRVRTPSPCLLLLLLLHIAASVCSSAPGSRGLRARVLLKACDYLLALFYYWLELHVRFELMCLVYYCCGPQISGLAGLAWCVSCLSYRFWARQFDKHLTCMILEIRAITNFGCMATIVI